MTTLQILNNAKAAKNSAFSLTTEIKNRALEEISNALIENTDIILSANQLDVEAAKGTVSDVMIDRLTLDSKRIKSMADGILTVAALPDPCGKTLNSYLRDDGLLIEKVSAPFGVIAVIYESRPNVTSDAAALTLKSGNVCILRGGKEAYRSSKAIVDVMRSAIKKVGLDENLINLIDDTTRTSADELMKANGYVDLLIPRGGAGLINACLKNATVPCLQTGTGICHVYVDKCADIEKALKIVNNAKTSRPSVCNAAEVMIVHSEIANEFLPKIKKIFTDDRKSQNLYPVELVVDERAAKIINGTPCDDNSFDTEFLDYKMAVKIVDSVEEAVSHILSHSTGHSEAIISEDESACNYFAKATDSAAVYINASTRFTDGGEFGLGCEIGISTQKMHARGPVGLEELNTYKYIVKGNGNIR